MLRSISPLPLLLAATLGAKGPVAPLDDVLDEPLPLLVLTV